MTDLRCPRCGEARLVEPTKIGGFCNVCSYDWDERSYDQRQIEAPLVQCVSCGKCVYMVWPQDRCQECR